MCVLFGDFQVNFCFCCVLPRKKIKDKEGAAKLAPTPSSTPPAVPRHSPDNLHAQKPGAAVAVDADSENTDQCRLMSTPAVTTAGVRKVSVSKVQPLTESPVPCGDSFFEDVNAFTQSHMTYMRGFKTPAASPVIAVPSAGAGQGSFRGRETPSTDRWGSGLLSPNRNSAGSESLGSEEGSSWLPSLTSEDAPIVLSQENSLVNVHEAGGCDFDQTGPIPVRKETSFKSPAVPSTSRCKSPDGQIFLEPPDDIIDDFDDDDADLEFGDVDIECVETQAHQASSSSSSDSAHQSTGVEGNVEFRVLFPSCGHVSAVP